MIAVQGAESEVVLVGPLAFTPADRKPSDGD